MSKKEISGSRRVPKEAKILGKNISRLRLQAGLTRREFGDVLGVSFQQIQKYETGANRFPIDKMFLLKNYLGVSYESFFLGLGKGEQSVIRNPSVVQGDLTYEVYLGLSEMKDPIMQKKILSVVRILAN